MASRTCRQLFRNYLSFISRNRPQFRKVKIPKDRIQTSNNLQAFNWNKFRLTLQYIASKVKLKHVVGTNVIFCAVAFCYNGSKNGKIKDAFNFSFKIDIFYREICKWCYILQYCITIIIKIGWITVTWHTNIFSYCSHDLFINLSLQEICCVLDAAQLLSSAKRGDYAQVERYYM